MNGKALKFVRSEFQRRMDEMVAGIIAAGPDAPPHEVGDTGVLTIKTEEAELFFVLEEGMVGIQVLPESRPRIGLWDVLTVKAALRPEAIEYLEEIFFPPDKVLSPLSDEVDAGLKSLEAMLS